jgi:hypothetical protein
VMARNMRPEHCAVGSPARCHGNGLQRKTRRFSRGVHARSRRSMARQLLTPGPRDTSKTGCSWIARVFSVRRTSRRSAARTAKRNGSPLGGSNAAVRGGCSGIVGRRLRRPASTEVTTLKDRLGCSSEVEVNRVIQHSQAIQELAEEPVRTPPSPSDGDAPQIRTLAGARPYEGMKRTDLRNHFQESSGGLRHSRDHAVAAPQEVQRQVRGRIGWRGM